MADDVVEHPGRSEQQAPRERERAARRARAPARALIAHGDRLSARRRAWAPGARSRPRASARASLRYQRSSASAAPAPSGARSSSAPALQSALGRLRGDAPERDGLAAVPRDAGTREAERVVAADVRGRARARATASVKRAVDRPRPRASRHDQLGADSGHEHEPQAAGARRTPQPHLHRSAAQEHRALALHVRQTMRRAGGADHRAAGAARGRSVLARELGRARVGRHAGGARPRDLARDRRDTRDRRPERCRGDRAAARRAAVSWSRRRRASSCSTSTTRPRSCARSSTGPASA